MIENPRPVARIDATRKVTDFSDLLPVVARHLALFTSAEAYIGPYNSRERSKSFYTPPTRETLRQIIRPGGVHELVYSAFLNSLVRFCEDTKGLRALPMPHPSTIHSIQLPANTFELKGTENGTELYVLGMPTPVVLKGLRQPDTIKFVILRPKLSRNGTPSATQWEALLFTQNYGYLPAWTDSTINPRWAGKLA